LAHSTKGTPSPPEEGSDRPDAHGFRFSFTPRLGVLFTVPSRYWCTIGRRGYLALGRGRPRFPPDFACPAVLTFMTHPVPAPSPTGLSPSPVRCSNTARLGQPRRASGLLSAPVITFNPTPAAAAASYAEMVWAPPGSLAATTGILSSPRGTEMFQFPRFPPHLRAVRCLQRGLPHSDSAGSSVASTSPARFAAWPRPSSAPGA
jgi:hypothetical protein